MTSLLPDYFSAWKVKTKVIKLKFSAAYVGDVVNMSLPGGFK